MVIFHGYVKLQQGNDKNIMMIPRSFTAQVVEFEDLLRPNEAMALLEAARVTAERRLALADKTLGGWEKSWFS